MTAPYGDHRVGRIGCRTTVLGPDRRPGRMAIITEASTISVRAGGSAPALRSRQTVRVVGAVAADEAHVLPGARARQPVRRSRCVAG
jgi:hypothetical protein